MNPGKSMDLTPVIVIEASLRRALDELDLPSRLKEAMAYATLGGGKRLRPMLAWHAAAAMDAPGECSLPAGIAVEFIHAFSLIHDDLPAMDDDDLRRGKPTLHIHAGEAMAILAGDALEAAAFAALVGPAVPARSVPELVRELSAGTLGMIGGQVLDTLGGPTDAPPPVALDAIHRSKTGALIVAACRMGAILGLAHRGLPTQGPALDAITTYAQAVGLMFQIVDDLIDVEQPPEAAGKRTGKDEAAGKLTYPSVHGVASSREAIIRLRAEAFHAVSGLGPAAQGLMALSELLSARTH